MYKREYGFTFEISNYKKNVSFDFTISGNLKDPKCWCFEISGKRDLDPDYMEDRIFCMDISIQIQKINMSHFLML